MGQFTEMSDDRCDSECVAQVKTTYRACGASDERAVSSVAAAWLGVAGFQEARFGLLVAWRVDSR